MFNFFRRRQQKASNGVGKQVTTPEFREIERIRKRLKLQKTVPKSKDDINRYWKNLSRQCELLVRLKNLPETNAQQSEMILAGKDVPPFSNEDRWHYYRWCRVKMAQQLQREKKFKTAFGLWSEIAIIDDLKLAFEDKIYLGGIENCINRGKISKDEAHEIFTEIAKNFLKCEPLKIWDTIQNSEARFQD